MAIRYIQTGDELPVHSVTGFDDDSALSWWGGVFNCAANLALATAVALTAGQTVQAQAQWTRDVQEPAGSLYNPPFEDDSWLQGPAPALPGTLNYPQQWTFDEQSPALFGQPDEDFWANPTPPVPGSLAYPQQWTFDEQTPALFGQPDEDFWQNPTPPVVGSLAWTQQWTFDQQEPAGSLKGPGIDEDFWLNPVAPVQGTNWQALPYWYDDSVVGQSVVVTIVDEDFWQNPAPPPLAWQAQPFQVEPDFVGVVLDEDFWQNSVAPVFPSNTWTQPWMFDSDAVVPQPTTFQPDEDFWFSATLPVWPVSNRMFLPLVIDDGVWVTNPSGTAVIPTMIYLGGGDDDTVASGTRISIGGIG